MLRITAAYIVGAVAEIRVVRELELAQDLAAGAVLPLGSAQAPAADMSLDPAHAKDRFPNYLWNCPTRARTKPLPSQPTPPTEATAQC